MFCCVPTILYKGSIFIREKKILNFKIKKNKKLFINKTNMKNPSYQYNMQIQTSAYMG